MTKAERTRQYIIDVTAPVFNRRGYAGTSLMDITKATRLTKGALYGNFNNKEEIALAVFHHSMQKLREAVNKEVIKSATSKEKLLRFFGFYGKYVFKTPVPGGCPLMNNAVEADDNNFFLKKAVALEAKKVVDYLEKIIISGVQQGEFRGDIKAKEIATMFFCSIEGAIVLSRVSSSDFTMKAVINQCKQLLEQISL